MTVADILPIGSGEYEELFFVLFPNTHISTYTLISSSISTYVIDHFLAIFSTY